MATTFLSNPIFPANSSDPSSTSEGEMWYNSTLEKIKVACGTGSKTALTEELLASVSDSSSTAQGAKLVGVYDADGHYTATNVEAVLKEIMDRITATTAGNGASMIGVEDSAGVFSSTNVEAVLGELQSTIGAVVSGRDFVNSVNLDINYLVTVSGAPSYTDESAGEILLNTADEKYYTVVDDGNGNLSFDNGTDVSSGMRFIFKSDGDGSGSGYLATANHKIYEEGSFDSPYTPTEGSTFWHEYDNKIYTYNGSAWVLTGSLVDHNNLGGLQGGQSGEYYHLTSADYTLVTELDNSADDKGCSQIAIESSSDIQTAITADSVAWGDHVQGALDFLYESVKNSANFSIHESVSMSGNFADNTVTHNLGTKFVLVQAFKDDGAGAPAEAVDVRWEVDSSNAILVQIANAQTLHFIISGKES